MAERNQLRRRAALRAVRRNWRLVVLSALAAAAAAVVANASTPDVYEATASLVVERPDPALIGDVASPAAETQKLATDVP
jgi:uncharacterized protein involved in exopolysaccharide biosynthesis